MRTNARPVAQPNPTPNATPTTAPISASSTASMPNSAIRTEVASGPSSIVASFCIEAVRCARSDASEVMSISG